MERLWTLEQPGFDGRWSAPRRAVALEPSLPVLHWRAVAKAPARSHNGTGRSRLVPSCPSSLHPHAVESPWRGGAGCGHRVRGRQHPRPCPLQPGGRETAARGQFAALGAARGEEQFGTPGRAGRPSETRPAPRNSRGQLGPSSTRERLQEARSRCGLRPSCG
jgi:hypothetical protein